MEIALAIPLSYLASVLPGVLSAGDSSALYALMLTQNDQAPTGGVMSFSDAASVGALFGNDSQEYASAAVFFGGFTNSPRVPSVLYVCRLADAEVAAALYGAKLGLTLAQLQALSGTMAISIDGTAKSVSLDFSTATSFSNAASMIETALGTGTVTYSSGTGGFIITGATSGTTYTVATVAVDAAGTGYAAGETVSFGGGSATVSTVGTDGAVTALVLKGATAQGTDPAGTGLATTTSGAGSGLTVTTTATSATTGIPAGSAVSFATGTLADSLCLSQASGAVQSLAVLDASVAAQMDTIKAANGMWTHFFCAFDPSDQKADLAAWTGAQDDNYAAILHDTAVTTAQISAGTAWAQANATAGNEGIAPVFSDPAVCALIAAVPCSVDWSADNGRYNVAFRRASGVTPTVLDQATATALEGAGYNFYGQYAGMGTSYNGVYPGCVSGQYLWLDSYFNQIWMRRNFQLNLIDLLFNIGQVPYNSQGDALIEQALMPTITAALNFGSIKAGVALSELQIQSITQQFGNTAAQSIQLSGYYLYVNASGADAATRSKRQTPEVAFYYTDGQSVQRITMNSVEVA